MTLVQRALERLDAWPDLTVGPASCGTGRALHSPHSEIVHFHTDHEADVYLTSPASERFYGGLAESTAIRFMPGSRWVTVRLGCDTDVDLLLSLVSVALHAHRAGPEPAGPHSACNFRRVTVLWHDRGMSGSPLLPAAALALGFAERGGGLRGGVTGVGHSHGREGIHAAGDGRRPGARGATGPGSSPVSWARRAWRAACTGIRYPYSSR